MDDAGTYALMIYSSEYLSLKIGRLGAYEIPPGFYVYVGSALRGLKSRLKHHTSSEKSLHWHIDYLLLHTRIIQIWYSLSSDRLECKWNAIAAGLSGATPVIRGFGSSDCKCWTHLTRFSDEPSFESFRKELKKRGLPQVHRLKI
jgi:Uri superfamily endonuclease